MSSLSEIPPYQPLLVGALHAHRQDASGRPGVAAVTADLQRGLRIRFRGGNRARLTGWRIERCAGLVEDFQLVQEHHPPLRLDVRAGPGPDRRVVLRYVRPRLVEGA